MDFIITWVNTEDPEWRKLFSETKLEFDGDKREARFRDWKNLHLWLRGVEKFAPWVKKIHLVISGNPPDWLNKNHPKLNIVKHTDFIPEEYLPTFNSRAIELNFHRIEGLNEQYVYFNDDFFIIDKLKPSYFFKNGKPCDMAISNALGGGNFARTLMSNIEIINAHFSKRKAIKEKIGNWLTPRYGTKVLRTLFLLPWPMHTGFYNPHLPQPGLKSTLKLIWEKEFQKLNDTCTNRFRNYNSVNPYIQRYWELASNNFEPYNMLTYGIYIELAQCPINDVVSIIQNQEKSIIALNDQDISNFEDVKKIINEAYSKILPEKSEFEI